MTIETWVKGFQYTVAIAIGLGLAMASQYEPAHRATPAQVQDLLQGVFTDGKPSEATAPTASAIRDFLVPDDRGTQHYFPPEWYTVPRDETLVPLKAGARCNGWTDQEGGCHALTREVDGPLYPVSGRYSARDRAAMNRLVAKHTGQ
jgi:hypothetical protein